MSHSTQLTYEVRYQIYALLKMDHTQTEIAKLIGVHKSTVSKGVRHNHGLGGYKPKYSHGLIRIRR